tara:strand:- start:9049 stop:10761 length:1713 start_codon:yes stop_codon:yes gene_type:complete
MEENKIRLNSASSQESVNEDSFLKLKLESKTNLIPVGNIENVINLGEQFNKEREKSPYYRLTGTFNTLFNNVLFNTTGVNSLKTFNNAKFRDITFPSNATTISDLDQTEGDLTYEESINKFLKEDNGWFGFKDPDPDNTSFCVFTDMEPNRNLFSMSPKNGVKNWEITVTFPIKVGQFPGDITNNLVSGGLLIADVEQTIINNRNMLTFTTPVKHGLSQGDTVKLKNLSSNNGKYTVVRLGKDNGDDKEYSFSVDINILVTLNVARMVRFVGGRESIYYVRRFKKITVRDGFELENDDYEIFPLAFCQTIYEDKVPKFVLNEDVDISNLKDNLGRPLSELYLTVIKTDSGGVFTPTKSGIKMPFISEVASNLGIPDINRISNSTSSHIPLDEDVNIEQDEFYGDVVEYNVLEQEEKVLADVYHSFNTMNRVTANGGADNIDFSGTSVDFGLRYEGYLYKAHHRIQIRQFSTYVEQGTFTTLNKPTYASNLRDGRFIWRDLLDIGVNDGQNKTLDYPFLNGGHYINSSFTLALERQDPFNYYGLQYTAFPADEVGILVEDKFITKNTDDVC